MKEKKKVQENRDGYKHASDWEEKETMKKRGNEKRNQRKRDRPGEKTRKRETQGKIFLNSSMTLMNFIFKF